MSKQPQLNLRIPAEHHELCKTIGQRLRESNGAAFAASLAAFIEGAAPAPGISEDLTEKVERLEEWIARVDLKVDRVDTTLLQALNTPRPDPETVVLRAKPNAAIPVEVLAEADRLNREENISFAKIIKAKKLDISPSGLGNAVRRYRQDNAA